MGVEKDLIDLISKHPAGISISDISAATGHTRATIAKYLEMLKIQGQVDFREVGMAKLWIISQNKKKILIAEDEEHIRRLIKVILSQENYLFVEAKDGVQALEKVNDEMPDLIILDWMMPRMDGIVACKELKRNVLTRKIPVIILTAKQEMADKVQGITAGADDYITKPFEPRELRARVKSFLEKERTERSPITNLPTFDNIISKLKNLDENLEIYKLSFANLDIYRKDYGFSKTNELIRLTAQMITHILDRPGDVSIVGHSDEYNFIIAIKVASSKSILKEIKDEFELTIPFFYDTDYESLDKKSNLLIKTDISGKISKVPLLSLEIKKLDKKAFL